MKFSGLGLVIVAVAACSYSYEAEDKAIAVPNSNDGIAVLELFTSQGCSSCPPADKLLGEYVQQQNQGIIPLAFHVDYWNRLGWKDEFSSNEYSKRQSEYANEFHLQSIYTPQVIINGQYEMVGSDRRKIDKTINEVLQQKMTASITADPKPANNKIVIDYKLTGDFAKCNLRIALVQNKAVTQIGAGENGGKKLTEFNIVRSFKTIEPLQATGQTDVPLPQLFDTNDCSVILYLQQKAGLKIIAAAKIGL